jgi:phospholipid/cholesterol/gamma-HCH transport system substrate-binding protein
MLIDQDLNAEDLRRGTRWFLVAGLLIAVGLAATILVRQGMFRQTASLGFVANSAQDISKGQSVKIAGFRVGSVDEITLQPDGSVAVQLEIDAGYMRFVTKDATVELRKEGFVGGATLEILPGVDKTRLASDQATLQFSRAEGLTAVANSLRDKLVPVLDDIKTITATLADPQTGLSASLGKVRDTSGTLQTLLQTGNQQLGAVGKSAAITLDRAQEDLGRAGQTIETVNARLPALLTKTQDILNHVEAMAAEAKTTLPPTLKNANNTVADVNEIVSGAKNAWPIKTLLDAKEPVSPTIDSDPRAEGTRVTP